MRLSGLGFGALGFGGLGFAGLGFAGLGFAGLGFAGLGLEGLAVRKIKRPEFHVNSGLLKGTDENYSWLGEELARQPLSPHHPDRRGRCQTNDTRLALPL